ncbi:acyltransferase [Aestuariibaculum suncheonense]|uniref:Acyltransferase n=2 Tax=Aestuariibaculum suncheonense TaxID=1028745 RepID=A0A8J6U9V3_9FLAO|nr:acyltransferase [Aestuariibaculum suncheonense]
MIRFLFKAVNYFKRIILFHYFKFHRNIKVGKGIMFHNKPLIHIHKGALLDIGDNVTINSKNLGYHVNMYSRCKLMADRDGAIIKIGNNTRLHGSCIHAIEKIVIGKNCLIAANCQIIDGNGHDLSFSNVSNRINTIGNSKPVIIEDDVWLATGVIVLPGVKIGKGSVITANSVVNKDIPEMVIAGGNPIKILKEFP